MSKWTNITLHKVCQIFLTKLVPGQVAFKNYLPSRMSCLSNISSQWLNISHIVAEPLQNQVQGKKR